MDSGADSSDQYFPSPIMFWVQILRFLVGFLFTCPGAEDLRHLELEAAGGFSRSEHSCNLAPCGKFSLRFRFFSASYSRSLLVRFCLGWPLRINCQSIKEGRDLFRVLISSDRSQHARINKSSHFQIYSRYFNVELFNYVHVSFNTQSYAHR